MKIGAYAWEQRKLLDIVTRINKGSNSNQLPKVEFEDIIAGEGRLKKDISNKFDDRKGIEFEPSDILYGKLRPYLKNWFIPDFKGIALGDFWIFRAKKTIPAFIYNLIQANKYQKAANDTAGTKMPRSDWKKVSKTVFPIPTNKGEQKKIGTFFKQLDETIALHQRKLEQLKLLKQAYLQNLFPQKGEKVPKVRFANFEEDWEERKLGEVLKKNTNKNKNLSINNVESVSNKTGFTKQTEQFEDYSVASADLSNYYIIDEKQFAYNPSRINVGSIAYKSENEKRSVVSPLYVSFSTSENLDDSFLWYWFKIQDFEHQRQIFSEGGVRDTLSFNQLVNMRLSIPKIEEQQKIGITFKQLDNLAENQEQNIKSLQSLKQAYLQKMFV